MELITETSFKGQAWEDTYITILQNYIKAFNEAPTMDEFQKYKSNWFQHRAPVRCDICNCVLRRDALRKPWTSKTCLAKRAELRYEDQCIYYLTYKFNFRNCSLILYATTQEINNR